MIHDFLSQLEPGHGRDEKKRVYDKTNLERINSFNCEATSSYIEPVKIIEFFSACSILDFITLEWINTIDESSEKKRGGN